MQEKIELNLNNPIFVCYINLDGLSRQRGYEQMQEVIKSLDIYKNATMWFLPGKNNQETRIECIYDGWGRNRDSELFDLIKEINTRVDILSNSKNFEDFKMNVREWRLGTLLEDGDNEKQNTIT
jgi:hypothetical protein